MKAYLKVIAFLIFLVIFLLLTAVWFLPRAINLEKYVDDLTGLMESSTGKGIQIGKAGLIIFPGLKIYANDVIVCDKPEEGGQEIIRIGKIYSRLQLLPLLRRRVVINSVRIYSPEIRSVKNLMSLPMIFLSDSKTLQGKAGEALTQKGGKGRGAEGSRGFVFDISHLNEIAVRNGRIDLEETFSSGKRIRLPIENVSIIMKGIGRGPHTSISASALFSEKDGKIKISGTMGKIDPMNRIPLELESSLIISDASFLSDAALVLFGLSLEGGSLDLESSIRGSIGKEIEFAGKGNFTDLILKKSFAAAEGEKKDLDGDISYSMLLQPAYLMIENVKLTIGDSEIFMDGEVDLKKEKPVLKFRVKGEDLLYSEIKDISPVIGFQSPEGLRGGRLDATLMGKVSLQDFTTEEFSGDAYLEDFQLINSALSAPVEDLECRIKISDEGVKISGMKWEYQKERMEGEIFIQDSKVLSASFRFGLFDGMLRGSLRAPARSSRDYSLDASVSSIDANALVTALFPSNKDILFGDLQGRADFKIGDFSMDRWTSDLSGSLELKIMNGRITTFSILKQVAAIIRMAGGRGIGENETGFELLEGDFNVSGGEARTDNLKFHSQDIDLDGEGVLKFDSSVDFNLEARFSPQVSRDMIASTPMLKFRMGRDGRLSFPLKIKGTIMKPEVVLDMNKVLKESTKEELMKSIKEFFRKR
ncbi:MAG: AsmA-like C-terminal domain-containing protein [Acidobacteriota bacterium]